MRPLTIITADTHAGGSHEQYREFLDPEFLEDFDAWRGRYKNPWKDLRNTDLRVRNWDDERRDADQLADGVVGEVLFPNTVPPFYPGFVLFAGPPKPEEYRHRRAGIRAHNRWLADFCAAGRRGGRASGRSSSTTSRTPSPTRPGYASTDSAAASSCRRSRPTSSGSSRSTTPSTTGCGRRCRTSTCR